MSEVGAEEKSRKRRRKTLKNRPLFQEQGWSTEAPPRVRLLSISSFIVRPFSRSRPLPRADFIFNEVDRVSPNDSSDFPEPR